VCALLPGCPLTDHYSIQATAAGSGPLAMSGGASEFNATAGTTASAGHLEAGGDAASANSAGATGGDVGTGSGGKGTSGAGAGGLGEAGASSDSGGTSAGGMSAGGRSVGGASAAVGGVAAAAGDANGGAAQGGAAGTGGGPAVLPDPACAEGVGSETPCTPQVLPLCYKNCGPSNLGYKSLICQNGMYNEPQDGCRFPVQDYSCYKVPTSLPTDCPVATVPRAGRACQVPICTPCFGGPLLNPQYQDSTGAQKTGFCVCSEAGVWTCASYPSSWPCPGGQGCK